MRTRLAYLDGLRGVAILMVFVIHSGSPTIRAMGPIGVSFIDHGKFGVTVFFVVSAFSLCLSLNRAFDYQAVSWKAYFIRRFFRIAPLYYTVLAFAVISGLTVNGPNAEYSESLIYHVTFANVVTPWFANDIIGVEWSIAVEWAFYLLLPAIIVLCRLPYGIAILILISVGLFWRREEIVQTFGQSFYANRDFTILWHMFEFTIGIFTYLAAVKKWVEPGMRRAFTILSVIMFMFLLWYGESKWSPLMVASITGTAIINASAGGVAARALSWRPLVLIGIISYSVYLLHIFIIGRYDRMADYLDRIVGISVLEFIGTFGMLLGTIAISTLTYFAIEQPFRALGGAIVRRINGPKADTKVATGEI